MFSSTSWSSCDVRLLRPAAAPGKEEEERWWSDGKERSDGRGSLYKKNKKKEEMRKRTKIKFKIMGRKDQGAKKSNGK